MHQNGQTQRRRRIVHITLGLDVGGQEKLLVEFARHADGARFELFFVSLSSRGGLARDLELLGWAVYALEEPPGLRPGMVLRLARLLRRLRPDVVHTHDDKPLLYGALAARLACVPRIVHTKHYGQVAHLGRRHRWLARLATRLTDRFVCVSHDSAQRTVNHGIADRVETIWNGIDLSRFGYRGPRVGGPVVCVARLSKEKDVATLLRAVALAQRGFPSLCVEIAGTGPCLPELKQLTESLALEEHVRFLGEVHDVPSLLSRASLFVLPSWTEGISLTLLEAMARGLPVVAMRVGGNPEVVQEGETGLLVPPRDPEALADAIVRLQQHAELGERLGRAGRQRVEQHFEVGRMVASYERLYEGLLSAAESKCARSAFRLSDVATLGYVSR